MKYYPPVGTWADRTTKPPYAGWWDATGFGSETTPEYVKNMGAYHTGADLNLNNGADSGKPVYSMAQGVVVYAGDVTGWQGATVVVRHPDGMWTRYAHLDNLQVKYGDAVTERSHLGNIADYKPLNSPSGDHLHFDVSSKNLGAYPGDWPKMDLVRLERDYRDPRKWILSHWNEENNMALWTPTDTTNGTRVRFTPDLAADNIIGVIEGNKVVEGTITADGKWLEVKATPEVVKIGDVTLKQSAAKTFKAYASAQFMKPASNTPPVQPPPVIVTPTTAIGKHPALPALAFNKRTGVHTMERIEEARETYNLGCRAFTMMDNIAGAREMRSKGAAVIARRFIQHGAPPNPVEFARYFGVNADDTLIVMGTNEADNISTSDVVRRFEWDRAWALEMRKVAPKCFVVIGSFSMGTPQLDDLGQAKLFRETYGAFLNANADWCGINYHSYHRRHAANVPPFNHQIEDGVWWPKRFITWGYNPQHGGLNSNVVCVSDEAGVDIGGIGGFPACGYNDNLFANWHAMQKEWFEPFPQVYIQNIFQFSPRQDWAGYNCRVVLGGLTKVWQS